MKIVTATFFLIFVFFPFSSAAPDQQQKPDCDIDSGPCRKDMAGMGITFEIEPRPVKAMKELNFRVLAAAAITAPTLIIDLSMPGMYMGRNEVVLKKRSDGSYTGKGIIPRCPFGHKLWQAKISLPGKKTVIYTFNVSY